MYACGILCGCAKAYARVCVLDKGCGIDYYAFAWHTLRLRVKCVKARQQGFASLLQRHMLFPVFLSELKMRNRNGKNEYYRILTYSKELLIEANTQNYREL